MTDSPGTAGQLLYDEDGIRFWWGDCTQIGDWLDCDTLVTDPPYGRNWKQGDLHANAKTRNKANSHGGIQNDRDTSQRDDILARWGGKPAIVFGDLMLPPPEGCKQVLVYHKPADTGVRGATSGYRRDVEAIYLVGKWPSGIAYGGYSSVIGTGLRMVSGSHGLAAKTGHPHTKPNDVMCTLLERIDEPGVIADPFAGSGSTLIAARELGLQAVGVEIDKDYAETCVRRLRQVNLF
jgi:predicted RNA methylase